MPNPLHLDAAMGATNSAHTVIKLTPVACTPATLNSKEQAADVRKENVNYNIPRH